MGQTRLVIVNAGGRHLCAWAVSHLKGAADDKLSLSPFFLALSLTAGSAPPTRATLAGVPVSCVAAAAAAAAERLPRVLEAIDHLTCDEWAWLEVLTHKHVHSRHLRDHVFVCTVP